MFACEYTESSEFRDSCELSNELQFSTIRRNLDLDETGVYETCDSSDGLTLSLTLLLLASFL